MPPTFSSGFTQCFPPAPAFAEKDVPGLTGKVYIVTGATSGIGREIARILYSRNATVYLAGREESDTIQHIKKAEPRSAGVLVFLPLDLSDLRSVKTAAKRFLAAETRLHVLFNNAGVMTADDGPGGMERTAQGYEMQLGVNCLGPFLFTKLLMPTLLATAADKSGGITHTHTHDVRVVFVSSFGAEMFHEPGIGIDLDNLDYHNDPQNRACTAMASAKSASGRTGSSSPSGSPPPPPTRGREEGEGEGVLGVPVNPGNLRSGLFARQGLLLRLQVALLHYPAVQGAYTELFAAFSPEVTPGTAGYVVPFGRLRPICEELRRAARPEEEGGADLARRFWEWSEEQVAPFA
ncbi:estradiol 17 beta-dehydrogenase [Apiospora hydei]|uniref:Estradiol 17 beta-dehydrogenase n=1 Tax=Apiospora hydei TaxID=1337664 RepID=A0ABR1VTL1_9PEZI